MGIQDVANLGNEEANMHCHQCYATPYDKETNTLSLQWLPLNVRSSKCQFKHTGPCLVTYTQQDKRRDQLKKASSADKKKLLLKNHKNYGTTDDLRAGNGGGFIQNINYDDMLYGTGLIDGTDLINNLDSKHEKQVYQKMGKSLKKLDKKFWEKKKKKKKKKS